MIKVHNTKSDAFGPGHRFAWAESNNGVEIMIDDDGGLLSLQFEIYAELTQQHVRDLLPLLQHFAETGRLPEGEKE